MTEQVMVSKANGFFAHRIRVLYPMCILEIAHGIICMATFGLWNPNWALKYCFWELHHRKMIPQEERNGNGDNNG